MNARLSINAEQAPQVARLQSIFEEKHRLSRDLIVRAAAAFGDAWTFDFEGVLRSLLSPPDELAFAARGYAAFAFDSMRRQRVFETTRRYPDKTYSAATQEVYLNDRYMTEEYLPGLLLSHFLWPHHYRQLQFFDTAFLAPLARSQDPSFVEVGVGTALYSRRILERVAAARGTGFDISPSSCLFAERHMQAIGARNRYRMRHQDILAEPADRAPWLVCVEVLEHLEDPVRFLRALKAALAPGGRAFVTAALNAAHADHIYLYRSADEVGQQLETAGFTLEQSFAAAAYPPPAAGVPVPLAAAFIVT